MNEASKKRYVTLVEKAGAGEEFLNSFKEFIDSYDGSNEEKLSNFIFELLVLIPKMNVLQIKADGYDALEADQMDFDKDLEELKREYENIQACNLPEDPAVASSQAQ